MNRPVRVNEHARTYGPVFDLAVSEPLLCGACPAPSYHVVVSNNLENGTIDTIHIGGCDHASAPMSLTALSAITVSSTGWICVGGLAIKHGNSRSSPSAAPALGEIRVIIKFVEVAHVFDGDDRFGRRRFLSRLILCIFEKVNLGTLM